MHSVRTLYDCYRDNQRLILQDPDKVEKEYGKKKVPSIPGS